MKKLHLVIFLFVCIVQSNAQIFFGPENPISKFAPAKPEFFEAADLDSDGDLDALVAADGTSNLVWFENLDGLGNFSGAIELASGLNQPSNVIATDLDGDGDMDVVQAVWGLDQLFWLENLDGQGNFTEKQIIDDYISGIWRVRSADVDGDGDQDLIIAAREAGHISWYENLDGMGAFSEEQIVYGDMDNARDAYPVDFDNDGDLDVVTVDWFTNILGWHENTDGMGSFSDRKQISDAIEDINIVYCEDMDQDGIQDVIVRNRTHVFWIKNIDGGSTFGVPKNISDGETIIDYYPADFDGDNDIDLMVASTYDGNLGWFANDGNGNFDPLQIIPNDAGSSTNIFVADVDGDDDQDVIGLSYNKGWIFWHENEDGQGNTQIGRFISKPDISGPIDMLLEDLNNDGNKEIILASANENKIFLYERSGREGDYGDILELPGYVYSPNAVYAADLDKDGKKDVLSCSFFSGEFYWSKNLGNNHFGQPMLVGELQNSAADMIGADLDGDGDNDVAGVSLYANQLAIFVNDGTGNFISVVVVSDQLGGATNLLATDLDGDGDLDLVVASRDDDKISWFENQGNLNFSGEKMIDNDMNFTRSLAAGDFDRDGDVDLAATAYQLLKWYENTDGRAEFVEHIIDNSAAVNSVSTLETTDIDQDGDLDLFVASETTNNVNWYLNSENGNIFERQIPFGIDLNVPIGLGFDDVDGDGKSDVLVASMEDNKIGWYRSEEQPVFIEQPQDHTLCQQGEVSFTAMADQAGSYRWQISNPFNNWFEELEEDEYFSGVNSSELNVSVDGTNLNMARFRCVVTYLGVDFYSEPAFLYVDRLIEAYAGTDVEICKNWVNLYANEPSQGAGEWSILDGYGEFIDLHDPYPQISNVGHGTNVFLWTITNGSCVDEDEVQVIKYDSVAISVPFDTLVVNDGENAVFEVETSGDVISYQWYMDGSIINDEPGIFEGAQTSKLTIFQVADDIHPDYCYCVVEGECNWEYGPNIYLDVLSVNTQEVLGEELSLFPNPVMDKLTLQSTSVIKGYEMINAEGRKIKSKTGLKNHLIEIDVEDLPGGNYFLKVQLESGFRQLGFVK